MKTLEEIVTEARRGDADAACELVKRFRGTALGLASALLDDAHLAEDAVQATFVNALERLDQLREPAAFPAWLRAIVRTEAGRIIRSRRERPSQAPLDAPSPDRGPAARARAKETAALVRAALARLPEKERRTSELFYFEGMTLAEIAGTLDVPEGTVKRRLHDARRRLRNALLGHVEGPEPPDGRMPL